MVDENNNTEEQIEQQTAAPETAAKNTPAVEGIKQPDTPPANNETENQLAEDTTTQEEYIRRMKQCQERY